MENYTIDQLRLEIKKVENLEKEDPELAQELSLKLRDKISELIGMLIIENENYYRNELFITALSAQTTNN
jgi:hypothetical protein